MSGKDEPRRGTAEHSDTEEMGQTKLDQMIEEFIKKNPGKGTGKIHGGTYQS